MFHLIFAPIIITIILVSILARLILRPYWSPYRRHRFYYDPYYRHRHRGLITLLTILTLGRLFGRRW
jgi:uncharacterized membrane protein